MNVNQSVAVLSKLECAICFELMEDAMMTSCGHSFCTTCCLSYAKSTCPTCRAKVDFVIPNYFVRELICDLSENMTKIEEPAQVSAALTGMGFSPNVAESATKKAGPNSELAVEVALKMQGSGSHMLPDREKVCTTTTTTNTNPRTKKKRNKKEPEPEAVDRLTRAMTRLRQKKEVSPSPSPDSSPSSGHKRDSDSSCSSDSSSDGSSSDDEDDAKSVSSSSSDNRGGSDNEGSEEEEDDLTSVWGRAARVLERLRKQNHPSPVSGQRDNRVAGSSPTAQNQTSPPPSPPKTVEAPKRNAEPQIQPPVPLSTQQPTYTPPTYHMAGVSGISKYLPTNNRY
eukprot:TRINITY_DN67307_c3_g10_i1.p1 TRINITY_DN67307_c3_g10~~TRINITY_DN67307_c3_g10_i1.p1  ORF type:complete len:352 (-),score=40.31 TRINITY_DN67307_c3_g10_i1:865-1884(-)